MDKSYEQKHQSMGAGTTTETNSLWIWKQSLFNNNSIIQEKGITKKWKRGIHNVIKKDLRASEVKPLQFLWVFLKLDWK